nr:hypothetical protein [Hyphomonas sp. Mor2]
MTDYIQPEEEDSVPAANEVHHPPSIDESLAAAEHQSTVDRYLGKSCFVIMPFGKKIHPFTNEEIDFDEIYERLIEPVLKGIFEEDRYKRADSATDSGLIHSEMIEDIISSDVAIVDITSGNPNVLYELGVRHAAKRSGTVVIKRAGDQIPFNIGGIRAFEYPTDLNSTEFDEFVRMLTLSVRSGLDGGHVDSLVHGLHRGLNVTRRPRVIARRETFVYRWKEDFECEPAREFCIVTGDIGDISDVDAWVNPENTAMQMGRFYDNSVSATIRYYGAKRDPKGFVKEDFIANALKRAMANHAVVQPGTVLVTRSGALLQTNGVKRILHVAAQYGEPSKGYMTVRNASGCVSNCLRTLDSLNQRRIDRVKDSVEFDSVMIPLFGIRNPDKIPEQVARELVEAAVLHFEKHPSSLIDRVYFSAYTDVDKSLCEQAFKSQGLQRFAIEPQRRTRDRRRKRRMHEFLKKAAKAGVLPPKQGDAE